jgi:hypothetical protein
MMGFSEVVKENSMACSALWLHKFNKYTNWLSGIAIDLNHVAMCRTSHDMRWFLRIAVKRKSGFLNK